MQFLFKTIRIGKTEISIASLVWFSLAVIAVLLELTRGLVSVNNYFVFKQVFWHALHHQDLYAAYPLEYSDLNHYGPLYAILIAPFAVLNDYVGCFLWCIANAWILYYAVQKLNLTDKQKQFILLIAVIELMTAIQNVQYNPMVAALIILAFVFVEDENDFLATFCIALGFLTKVYGIAGLAFFLFSKHKLKFIGYFIFWTIVLACLPMLIGSPSFIIQCYSDWYHSLAEKNLINNIQFMGGGMQDISLMGMIRRIFHVQNLSNTMVLIPAAVLYLLPMLRFNQYKHLNYRLSYLALTLISVVILSSSAESPTYIIAVMGIAIWFVIQPKTTVWVKALLIFTFLFTILSPTDLIPRFIRDEFIRHYALKALPCVLVWMVLVFQLGFNEFKLKGELK